jgi:hypothetical protein
MTLCPGEMEFVPSGGLDRKFADEGGQIDYKAQLLEEFVEETGLPREIVTNISEFGVVFDKNDKVYDICCQIDIETTREKIKESFKNSEEYGEPVFVELEKLKTYLDQTSEKIIPTSKAIFAIYTRKPTS